ncbi:MAG: phenylalanine--tRNA ligase subunit alpha, partial [Abditibacteriota bacterium]|nr:phenylalanine--tRNA ligase subunit alpha [Abditibacteriota bacterium]
MNEFEDIKALEEEAKKLIESAKESSELDAIDTKFLGRKGELTLQLRKIGSLEPEKRKDFGAAVNAAKNMLAGQLADFQRRFAEKEKELRLKKETLDVTVPGRFYVPGTPHVLMETFDDIKKIFIG